MKHLIAIVVTALFTWPLSATHARCYVVTPAEAFAGAEAVFVGKVISVSDPTFPVAGRAPQVFNLVRPIKVRFAAERVYRGKILRQIEVETRTGGLEWGYDFKVGKRYLVYAQAARDNQHGLVVNGCGPSRLLNEATEDLKLLEGWTSASGHPIVSTDGMAADVAGTWTGRSICVGNRPACKNEEVVYRFVPVPGKSDLVTLYADKILDGKRVPMGKLDFVYDKEKGTLSCDFKRGQTHGLWSYQLSGDNLQGTLVIFPDKNVGRTVQAHRTTEDRVPKAPPLTEYEARNDHEALPSRDAVQN
ncbi:MAG: hypothetical protein QOD75_3955 [Blastocatellia bacterium]|jgi:hypothetical protein|nr:hypothetical protein [Blastocatellia bacterium]